MRYVCSEPRVPRPRDRGLAKRCGPTATPAFEPAFEFSRALAALSSSSASGPPPTLASSVDGTCSCTELYDINTNIYGIMSDSRRSPTTTPHSGGKGPASLTRAARGSRPRDRTPKAAAPRRDGPHYVFPIRIWIVRPSTTSRHDNAVFAEIQ